MKDEILKKLEEDIDSIKVGDYAIELGVISHTNSRDNQEIKNDEQIDNKYITNAELLFIQENGSVLNKIPSRPVLEMTIKYAYDHLLNKTLDRCLDGVLNKNWNRSDVETELKILGEDMKKYIYDLIYSNDGRVQPRNALSTIKAKGFDHPLFQTGQLAKSITTRLKKL